MMGEGGPIGRVTQFDGDTGDLVRKWADKGSNKPSWCKQKFNIQNVNSETSKKLQRKNTTEIEISCPSLQDILMSPICVPRLLFV